MTFLLLLIAAIVIYFLFIKKGREGKSFFNFRKDLHDHIDNKGGMLKIYESFVEIFKEEGFNVKRVENDLIELDYKTEKGKVEIQVVQIKKGEANIAISSKTTDGKTHDAAIIAKSDGNLKEAANRLVNKFSNNELKLLKKDDSRLRFDGLYGKEVHDGRVEKPLYEYLRFYKDGTFLRIRSTGQPEKIIKWFNKEHDGSLEGDYSLKENSIKFSTHNKHGHVDYTGEVLTSKIKFDTHHHVKKTSSNYKSQKIYYFTKAL